jgi:FdhD protein
MRDMARRVEVTRVRAGERRIAADRAATEEPLEIRLHDEPFAVIMRTPGADRDLAAGFLLSERLIRDLDDLATIEHCPDPDAAQRHNIVKVTLARGDVGALLEDRRRVVSTSACGVCGRLTIDSLTSDTPRIDAVWTLAPPAVAIMADRLREAQAAFAETGGLHAAGLFGRDGTLTFVAEDVGRHNAVDKVIGRKLLMGDLPLAAQTLVVSGRASYEIVQKAFVAGIPVVAAISAPSSLAVDLAHDAGITLLGFLRGGDFNIYTHDYRIR